MHYIETYNGETVRDLKRWIAEEYNCAHQPITLKHGEDVISDEILTRDLPRDGFITICLLQETSVVAKEVQNKRKSNAKRKQLKWGRRTRKVVPARENIP